MFNKSFLLLIVFVATAAANDSSSVHLFLSGGVSFNKMESINEYYINGFAREFGIFSEELGSGETYYASIRMPLRRAASIEVGVAWSRDALSEWNMRYLRDENDQIVDSVFTHYELTAQMWSPYVGIVYQSDSHSFQPWVGVGVALCFGHADLSASDEVGRSTTSFSARSIRPYVDAGLMVPIADRLSMFIRGGFRQFDTGTLEENGEPWVVDYPASHEIDLDFSGPYVTLGIAVGLH